MKRKTHQFTTGKGPRAVICNIPPLTALAHPRRVRGLTRPAERGGEGWLAHARSAKTGLIRQREIKGRARLHKPVRRPPGPAPPAITADANGGTSPAHKPKPSHRPATPRTMHLPVSVTNGQHSIGRMVRVDGVLRVTTAISTRQQQCRGPIPPQPKGGARSEASTAF